MSFTVPLPESNPVFLSEVQLLAWVASLIGVTPSERTLARWRAEGLPYLLLVGRCAYPATEAVQWLQSHGRNAAQNSPHRVAQAAIDHLATAPLRRRGRPRKSA